MAAGYRQTGPYMPGIGAHFIKIGGASLNPTGVMSDRGPGDPARDHLRRRRRRTPGSPASCTTRSSKDAPAGLRGPERPVALPHVALHQVRARRHRPAARLRRADPAEAVRGGRRQPAASRASGWCTSGRCPGWESGQGLFGEVNPALACPDGTYYQRPMKEWIAHPDNACKSASLDRCRSAAAEAEVVVDLAGRGRAVQRVEVQTRRATVDAARARASSPPRRRPRTPRRDRRRRLRACRRASAGTPSPGAATSA